MHSILRTWSGWSLVLLVAAVAGCGPAKYPKRDTAVVTGTVTYKGEPVSTGSVVFQPESGAFASGEIQPDGTYELEATIGPNRVQIVSREPEDETPAAELEGPRPIAKSYIPEIYAGPKSPLTFVVEPGDNTADFELKDIE